MTVDMYRNEAVGDGQSWNCGLSLVWCVTEWLVRGEVFLRKARFVVKARDLSATSSTNSHQQLNQRQADTRPTYIRACRSSGTKTITMKYGDAR